MLIKRIKNLLKFSKLLDNEGKLTIYADDVLTTRRAFLPKSVDGVLTYPHQAVIIKRESSVDSFLNNAKQNE